MSPDEVIAAVFGWLVSRPDVVIDYVLNLTLVDQIGWFAGLTAMLGSYLLSSCDDGSWRGFVLYLVSNASWIVVACISGSAPLFATQCFFTWTSTRGLIRSFKSRRHRHLVMSPA